MVGFAFTVQCTVKNDFLAVLRGLVESGHQPPSSLVLVVDTLNSVRAVSGELFATQAWHHNKMAGLLIDGPVRDCQQLQQLLDLPVFATGACPRAGTTQHPGLTQGPVAVGGVTVNPGDVVFGDADGIVTADVATMEALLPVAQAIVQTETVVRQRLETGAVSLERLTNYEEHLAARLRRQESKLEFRL